MEIFLKQFLLLGGFYFVISFFFGFSETSIANILDDIISLGTIVLIIILCFKKSYGFLIMLQNKYPKSSLYAMSLGGVYYTGIFIFTILGVIDGYSGFMAKYNGKEYESIMSKYIEHTLIFYGIISVLILLWATYANFIKPYLKKDRE